MQSSYTYSPDPFDRRARRLYAVAIFLPRAIENIVIPLRERYDTDYALIGGHITVVFPFETPRILDEIAQVVQREVEGIESFEVELSSIGDFYPESPIIYWSVKPSPELTRLYLNLYSGLDLPIPHKRFVPHVTVAREISAHRLLFVKDKIVSHLPEERFQVEAIDLIAPVADGTWVSVRTFQFRRP